MTDPLATVAVGRIRLTYLPDGQVQLHPERWYPDSTPRDWRQLSDQLDEDGYLVATIGALLVETDGRAMLIDAGFGAKHIPAESTIDSLGDLAGGELPESLRRSGISPEAIEAVAFTHLHDDHFGWAFAHSASGRFLPKARLLAPEPEWHTRDDLRATAADIDPVADGDEIFPGVTVRVTPGHTAGHTAYEIASEGERLIAFGDIMHAPLQIPRPHWGHSMDFDPRAADRSRRWLLDELSRPGTLGFGNHFTGEVFGRVVTGASGPAWEPVR